MQINVSGKLEYNFSLKKLTTWHVGGPGDIVFWPKDLADLQSFLRQLDHSIPVTWMGLGSNLLIRDGGIRGAVIITANMLKDIEFCHCEPATQARQSSYIVRAEAGMACPVFAKKCAKQNLTQGEFFAGIPGTIGGALNMNAGAFGGETWEIVDKVQMINRSGDIIERFQDEFKVSYRKVIKPDNTEWFLAGYFKLLPDAAEDSKDKITDLLRKRSDTQPIGKFSCGSVFRNPPDNFAAKLIENADLKGFNLGGAQVSTKHANFIINDKTATASDIEHLILYVKGKIKDIFEIDLIPEVHILGEHDRAEQI